MEVIRGLKVSRKYQGPASTLYNVVDQQGDNFMAIQFHEEFHDHPILNDSLSVVLEFLQSPMLGGISALQDYDSETGTFIFSTGVAWSLAEVIRILADMGMTAGPRAGLEFMFEGGRILADISASAQMYAVYSHGGLTPWRILLKKSGQIEVIGYALPQIELYDFLQGGEMPREDSFRYCPPERLRRENEDLDSDIYALALIAFELMTSRPIYDGTVDMIHQKTIRGEVSRQIFQSGLPKSVQNILNRALHPDRESRYERMDEFIYEIERALSLPTLEGYTLREVMAQASTYQPRTRPMQEMTNSPTAIFDKQKIRETIDEEFSDSEEFSEEDSLSQSGSGMRIQSFDIDEATMSRPMRRNIKKAGFSTEMPAKSQEKLRSSRSRVERDALGDVGDEQRNETPRENTRKNRSIRQNSEKESKVGGSNPLFQRVNRSTTRERITEEEPLPEPPVQKKPEKPKNTNQLIAMLRQSSNSMSDLSKSAQMPREREEELSKGAQGVLSAIQGKKEETSQRKTSSMLLSRNIVRGHTEDDAPSKKKQQPAKIPTEREEIEESEDFSSEDWSESEEDVNDSAATAAFVRPNPKKKVKTRSEIKKVPQPMLSEEDSMDEIEKAYKIMDEEGDVSRTLERPKQVKPQKKTEKPKHKEQMLQTLDVEQSKVPNKTTKQKTEEPQALLEQTVDQPKVSAEEVQQPIVKQTETTSSIPEEPIEPPAFDTGTTLRDGFGRIYKPYLLKPTRSTGQKVNVAIQLSTEENTLRFPLLSNTSLSELIGGILMGKYLPNPVNAMGQLMVYYQFMQNGVLLPSSLRIGQLATPIHLVLCTQQAEIVPCYIEIQQDSPTKKLKVLSVTQGLTLYTSTAITVHSLIDHCLHSFDLQSGNWEIFAMNKKLDRFMYVGEVKKAFKSKPLHLYLIRKS